MGRYDSLTRIPNAMQSFHAISLICWIALLSLHSHVTGLLSSLTNWTDKLEKSGKKGKSRKHLFDGCPLSFRGPVAKRERVPPLGGSWSVKSFNFSSLFHTWVKKKVLSLSSKSRQNTFLISLSRQAVTPTHGRTDTTAETHVFQRHTCGTVVVPYAILARRQIVSSMLRHMYVTLSVQRKVITVTLGDKVSTTKQLYFPSPLLIACHSNEMAIVYDKCRRSSIKSPHVDHLWLHLKVSESPRRVAIIFKKWIWFWSQTTKPRETAP